MLYGLFLNIGRIRWQRAWEGAHAIGLALSKSELPKEAFDAIALRPGEAEELERKENHRRAVARARDAAKDS